MKRIIIILKLLCTILQSAFLILVHFDISSILINVDRPFSRRETLVYRDICVQPWYTFVYRLNLKTTSSDLGIINLKQ